MPLLDKPGRHAAKTTASELGQSEQGSPFIQISFETADGSITGWLYLTEKALERSVDTLRKVFDFDGNFETVCDQINGKECSIVCENEEYQGKERLKVKWINSARSSAPINDQSAFLKSLSAKAARIPKTVAKAPPPTKPTTVKAPPAKPAVASTVKEPDPF